MSFSDLAETIGVAADTADRPVVCVQGLGFVGAAMAAAVARARTDSGAPAFNVVGVDLDTPEGQRRAAALNRGDFPFPCPDPPLIDALAAARAAGNLLACTDPAAFSLAAVAVVDVDLDVAMQGGRAEADLDRFRSAITTLGDALPAGALVIIETTVPPGTTAHVAAPALADALARRGLAADAVLLAHSYERVMPGPGYLDSVVNFWRVYAGHSDAAAEACARFLEQIVNTKDFPLTRLASTTASETAKVLENSYRATTIAFMEEWGRFAESVGVDLFEVIDAIRQRPTHSNMRQPGFGVGGYCITKDPLFAPAAVRQIFDRDDLRFPFSEMAVSTNFAMPQASIDHLERLLGGSLDGKSILLLGVAYRPDVADTRNSPAEYFVREARRRGAVVTCQDPLVRTWPELDMAPLAELPAVDGLDALVFAVGHTAYGELDVAGWIGRARPVVFDANRVLGSADLDALATRGITVAGIGRGMPA